MQNCLLSLVVSSAIGLVATQIHAGEAYPDPPGGWTYLFEGDQRIAGEAGSGFTSLDGTWSHDNGSDEWEGSEIGGTFGAENKPGGVSMFTEEGVTYLRIQDTGDPRDFPQPEGGNYADPSNRKIYFGHDMSARGASLSQLDDGVTLTFRARLPTPSNTTFPLDPLHRDGQGAGGVLAFPEGGDGYVTSDGGKGNFVIKQSSGGAMAFSFTQTDDTTGGAPTPIAGFQGLTFNEFNGNQNSAMVNFGQGTGTNVVAFDPTEWHELWIVMRRDPANVGTHQGFIYVDGSLEPHIFSLTAGTGSDYTGITYLAIGMTATPQNAALDIDFVGYRIGVEFPEGAIDNLPPEITDVTPALGTTFYPPANGISATATTQSTNSIPVDGVSLVLNGEDVSAALSVTGTEQNRTITYDGLESNLSYVGQLVVADQAGRSATNAFSFDTFVEAELLVIEAEDFNFDGGQFFDEVVLCNDFGGGTDGCYFDRVSVPGVDALDTQGFTDDGTDLANLYRFGPGIQMKEEEVDTIPTGDSPRPKYEGAQGSSGPIQDFDVERISAGDWLNYTRTWPEGTYQIYLRASADVEQTVQLERVDGDRTMMNQATTVLGSFIVPAGSSYNFIPLTDLSGNRQIISLSGVETLRLSAVSANENLRLNFFMGAPAEAGAIPPAVLAVFPGNGAVNVSEDAVLEAELQDGTNPLDLDTIRLFLDDADVTSSATITDTAGGAEVSYDPPGQLASQSSHTVRVEFDDDQGTGPYSFEWSFQVRFHVDPATLIISDVVETGGDGPVVAKWTGQVFDHPNLGPGYTVPPFGEDVAAFTDRTHQYNGASTQLPLPGYLVGGEYIMIRNDNRDNVGFQLDITLRETALVYLLIDNRHGDTPNSTPPEFTAGTAWVLDNGWEPVLNGLNRTADPSVPDEIGVDEGGDGVGAGQGINQWSSVYVREVPAGTVSVFDPDNPGRNMYGVVITAVPSAQLTIVEPRITETGFELSLDTENGQSYRVEYTPSLSAPVWAELTTLNGDGTRQTATDTDLSQQQRYYRVVAE